MSTNSFLLVAVTMGTAVAGVLSAYLGYRSGAKQVERLYERKRRLDSILNKYDLSVEDRNNIADLVLMSERPETQSQEVRPSYPTALPTAVMAASGSIAIIALSAKYWAQIKQIITDTLFPSAYGATVAVDPPVKVDLSWMVPWIIALILVVMVVAFLGSMLVLLTTKDIKENQAKIKAASDIVKTFGGFFSGIATTALSGALH
ncbi:hypothetical protein NKJ59_07565 [Mesorhizobium australicum]|uniref:hypothetical protein n=1 Tax=Mesorhizobium australicum TaxID=536018 RepID=UPI00333DE8F1